MRMSLHDLTVKKKNQLKKYDELSGLIDTLIRVELCAVGCKIMNIRLPLKEAWVLLTGYNEPIIPKHVPKDILTRLRILLSSSYGENTWKTMANDYFNIPEEHRLLALNEMDDMYRFITPQFDPNRKHFYEELLLNPIPYKASDKPFLQGDTFKYNRYSYNHKIPYAGEISKSWRDRPYSLLKEYRRKKRPYFYLDFNWQAIAREMDSILNNGKREWEKKIAPVQLRSIKNNKTFSYKGLQHIVGGLASGKSTFRTINTYWLVKHQQAKVGLVEGSVADVIERVTLLKQLGIHAVPIIGRSSRITHEKNHLFSQEFTSITEIANDDKLTYLSSICTIQALAHDKERFDSSYPCERLYTNNEKKTALCPIAHHCGVYKQWTELAHADVWVTTSAAILKTRIPAMIDPYKRYIYEAMYDLLDVIFVDEADSVMKEFDESFLNEYKAFGSADYLVEKLERQFINMTHGTYDLVDNVFVSEWQMNLHHLKENIWNLLAVIKTSSVLRDSLKNQVIYLNFFIYKIAHLIAKDTKHLDVIVHKMHEISNEANFVTGPKKHPLHSLTKIKKRKMKENIIETWLQNIEAVLSDDLNRHDLYVKIECFIYLAHIESSLKYIKLHYPFIDEISQKESLPILRSITDFHPFLKEAMTGVMFGYRYEHHEDSLTGDFKIIQYLAIGRDLLYQWDSIYAQADSKEGPTVILLSGTSYAPQSLHYHIEHHPDWIMTSSRQQSSLSQSFLPVRDPERNEQLINISGESFIPKRHDNLNVMIRELKWKIEEELSYWDKRGCKRRVLLVVNSYEDVEVVGKALDELNWRGKYRLLTNSQEKDDIWYPRSQIEYFSFEQADILVAPLLAVSRGYNIIDHQNNIKDKGALFGSAFFLIRPYPVPNNLSYYVQILHGLLSDYFEDIASKGFMYKKAMRHLRRKSRARFESMFKKPDFWSLLSEEEREVVAWYTFVPTWQLIGRLLRGGRDARIFYCDAKFLDRANGKWSMLESWQKIMNDNEDWIFSNLYGPFLNSIEQAIGERV